MPRPNYPLAVCLLFLSVIILIRTVAIAQHACGVLVSLKSCEYSVSPVPAVVIGRFATQTESSAVSPVPTAAPPRLISDSPVTNAHSGEYSAPPLVDKKPSELVGSPTQKQLLEKQRKRMASAKTLSGQYQSSSRSKSGYTYRIENTWGTAVW